MTKVMSSLLNKIMSSLLNKKKLLNKSIPVMEQGMSYKLTQHKVFAMTQNTGLGKAPPK